MKIEATPIPNGHRFISASGFQVEVTADQRFFTIYDSYGEACGTITRPRTFGGSKYWESHLPNGQHCTLTAVGPRSAFRSFVMGYTKVEG